MGLIDSRSSFISSGEWSGYNSEGFPDPFMDMASLAMPDSIMYALKWCEYLMFANGTYFRALDRIVSYFLTEVEVFDVDDDREKEKIRQYLHDAIGIINECHIAGLNLEVYGNDFVSVMIPFRRYLSCPKCSLELPIAKVMEIPDFKFRWADWEFTAYCPKCKHTGSWKHADRRSGDDATIKIKHWSPHEMELLWDPLTDDCRYIWKIPEYYRRLITEGNAFHLERANWEVIQCVKNNTNLLFEKDVIYHMKEPTLAGVRNRGWGISRVLSNFRQAWYVQVLHRYNEAIALDYVIPFRLITPAPGPGSGEPARDVLLNMNAGNYASQIQRMLKQRRRNPATWHTLPFPVQYQALGGDATQLAPRDLLDQGLETLLNNVGIPVELYKGTLQLQSAPASLRLFEASWSHLAQGLNGFIAFIMRRIGQVLNWEKATAKMRKVTHADDMQRMMARLQMMIGGQLSKQEGMGAIGVNYFEDYKRQMEEQRFEARQQTMLQEDMEQSSMMQQMGMPMPPGGGAPPGGAPMPPGGGGMMPAQAGVMAQQPTGPNTPTTPQDMMGKAQMLAQQILAMPESQKDSELINLKKIDPMMHAVVTQQIESARQQARTQGGAMMMAQQFGKTGGARKPGSILAPFKTLPGQE